MTLNLDGVPQMFADAVTAAQAIRERYYFPFIAGQKQQRDARLALGRVLLELREKTPHGMWEPAMQAAGIDARHARRAMNDARIAAGTPKLKRLGTQNLAGIKTGSVPDLMQATDDGSLGGVEDWCDLEPELDDDGDEDEFLMRELGLTDEDEAEESAIGNRQSATGADTNAECRVPNAAPAPKGFLLPPLKPGPSARAEQLMFAPLYDAVARLREQLDGLMERLKAGTVSEAAAESILNEVQRLVGSLEKKPG